MSQDEISVMDGRKCNLQVRGACPFFSDKFNITKHSRYKFLPDFDRKNEFGRDLSIVDHNTLETHIILLETEQSAIENIVRTPEASNKCPA